MLHPSYSDLMEVVNSEVQEGEAPIVNSRYSIVLATAKRARQLIGGSEPMVNPRGRKPLSVAIDELYKGDLKIVSKDEDEED
ncbi:DNA-directed RNA polymerase subunit omega [Lachnospiraceae bacterium]|nr:DNA-directed RNA polymerase subunit omega [Lachnospiraceae bacterium]